VTAEPGLVLGSRRTPRTIQPGVCTRATRSDLIRSDPIRAVLSRGCLPPTTGWVRGPVAAQLLLSSHRPSCLSIERVLSCKHLWTLRVQQRDASATSRKKETGWISVIAALKETRLIIGARAFLQEFARRARASYRNNSSHPTASSTTEEEATSPHRQGHHFGL
jgi:hypothetical protein